MEARELRIGNWIYSDIRNNVATISMLAIKGCCVDYNHTLKSILRFYDIIRPITITEEWLVKFGFEKSKHWYTLEDIAIYKDMARLTQKVDGMYVEIYNQFECPEYVHKLQNLYYELTGDELTIKSNPNDKS